MTDTEQRLRCEDCDCEIECCEFCDAEDCAKAMCYGCVAVLLSHSVPHPPRAERK
jgi:hypothetical protein